MEELERIIRNRHLAPGYVDFMTYMNKNADLILELAKAASNVTEDMDATCHSVTWPLCKAVRLLLPASSSSAS